jgi:intracellular septation protein
MDSRTRLFLDLGPLAAFFIGYKTAGLFGYKGAELLVATACIITFTAFSLGYTYFREKRIAPMPLVSGLAITVLGGLTLYLHDDVFVKMKPTLVNLLFSSILLGGLAFGRPMLKYLLDHAFKMDEAGWRKLSLRWGVFFMALAGLNEFIWRNYSSDFWVNFKVFGMFTLTMAFTLCQLPLIKHHLIEEAKTPSDDA